MKKLNLVFLIVFLMAGFYSCQKQDTGSLEVLSMQTLSGKWNVTDTASVYKSFEFNTMGSYIIVQDTIVNHDPIFGTYKIIDDKTIKLSDGGILDLSLIDDTRFNFSMTTQQATGVSIAITSIKADQLPISIRTDLLCRTWQMDSVNENSRQDTAIVKQVIFSQSGTYFENTSGSLINDDVVAQWAWKDENEKTICLALDGKPTCNGDNEIQIDVLTLSKLKYFKKGEIYVFHPSTSTP